LICADNAGWLIWSRSAARVSWPSSATAANPFSWYSSMVLSCKAPNMRPFLLQCN